MEHECNKGRDIEELRETVYGKDGLKESYIRMEQNIKQLSESAQTFATAVSAFTKFMNESEGAQKTQKYLVGIILTITTFLSGAIITLLIKLV